MEQLRELADLVGRHTPQDGMHSTALPRLALIRYSTATQPHHSVYDPALCIVVQGRKRALLGEKAYVYDPASFLIVSVDLPVVGCVIEASPQEPYLCLKLDLNLPVLSELLLAHGGDAPAPSAGPGLALSKMDPSLLDSVVRLLRLLDTPADLTALAPLAEREILYRLLTGEQGHLVRQVACAESRLSQISRAIAWIKKNYRRRFSIDMIAGEAGMSPSSLHEHFRAVTTMSPLQYQKQLRLQEARRLMLAEALDAATAGFRVGYESPSQFSREYRRLFGAPPASDITRLRALPEMAMVA
jgi:AraC-like DNA-binding protein